MNQSAGAAQHSRRYSSDGKDLGPIGPDRNWKGIGISLLVILLVLSLIGLSIVLLSRDDGVKPSGSQLTVDDLFHRDFQIHEPDAKWISGKEIIFQNWDGDVLKTSLKSNETQLLLKNTTFATFKASRFSVSPDLNYVLLGYDVKQVYQHSFLASYLVYNLYTREVLELNPPEVSDSVLQFASWGVRGQQLIYVFENNIYYQTDVQSSSWRLTSSGQEGIVFNGIADWLYEEEVLHTQATHWWAPDGTRLAYLTINDSLVPNMLLPRFTGALYPRGKEYPYPKMGQINPTVRLYVVTLDGSSLTTELRPPDSLEKSEFYITMVTWVTQERLSVRWVNRAQNTSILSLCDVTTAECTKKHVMTSEKWLDRQNEEPVFSRDCSTFFITLPLKHGDRGTFNHITMISNHSEDQEVNLRHLTSGSWEVSHILAYDETTNSVYFLSTEEGSAQRQLYRVSTVDPLRKECLTCSLFKSKCSFYDAALSPDHRHVLLNCRGPGLPQSSLHKLNDMNKYKIFEKNTVLKHALANRTLPKWERRTVQINDFALRLELIVPVDLDLTKEYPLVLVLDSAPGGQAVSERFSLGWESVLVSSDKVIVARLDGRGSGSQGQRVLHEVHMGLGSVDVQDQITVLEHLIRLPYIDGNRVGVYGKAYGGFLSSLLLMSHSSMFQCGIAVAPITNWRLSGSAFTEKYFGSSLTEDHRHQISSLLNNVTVLSPLSFLIIHGTADATVHFQHSAELVKLLAASNVNYTLQIFPDEGHDLASVSSRHYMLSSVLTFFRRCLEEEEVPVPQTSKEDD
ncbi:inactive dipeptidyl peptidase 10-like [Hippoglossus hippoglossus]|uniref:inactive dipeptidyl peptidase 10-like n=1 Tax=Hippoglossus hippoglossus TaxID=8267 RepID=UPI00148E0DC8|nr:inactive dipeptidyl peptidase 10-like [Hippoglossus hippoglossus]